MYEINMFKVFTLFYKSFYIFDALRLGHVQYVLNIFKIRLNSSTINKKAQ